MAPRARPNVGRTLETGSVLGALSLLLALTGLALSPTALDALGLAGAGPLANLLYVTHLAAAALLVAFTVWHLVPPVHALARKVGQSWASYLASLALLALVIVEIATGWVLWRHDYRVIPKAIGVLAHLATTFVLLAFLGVHAWRGLGVWRARRAAREAALLAATDRGLRAQARAAHDAASRRAFLRVGAYALAGLALAWLFGRAASDEVRAWRLNSVGNTPTLTKEGWRLRVTGLVEKPLVLTFRDLTSMRARTLRFTHHCVEGWTYTDTFTGVPLRAVLERAGVKPEAKQLVFKSAEISTHPLTRGEPYTTNFPVEDGYHDDVLLVFEVGGEDLPADHGFPVRLMTPRKWGYKACKWLTEIELTSDAEYRGYWEKAGYHNDGDYPGPIFG